MLLSVLGVWVSAAHGVHSGGRGVDDGGALTWVVVETLHGVGLLATCAAAKKTPPAPFPDASCAPMTDGCSGTNSAMRVGRSTMLLASALKSAMAAWVSEVRETRCLLWRFVSA